MKKINIPTHSTELMILDALTTSLGNSSGALVRYQKPYDRIIILKLMKSAITKALKATGN